MFSLFLSTVLCVLMSAASAQAVPITVNFHTTGQFAGCAGFGGGPTFATCTMGTATLTYFFNGTAATPDSVLLTDAVPTANAEYGEFQTSGGATLSNFAGVGFTLNLFQTSPSVGSQALVGAVSGAIQAPAQGQLLWGPVTPTSWDIGLIHWTIALDPAPNGIRIAGPGTGGAPGTIGGTASMVPTAVPEPSTIALMVSGAALLLGVRRRRRPTIA